MEKKSTKQFRFRDW